MHIEHIHFDEIFDAQPRGGDFSFKSKGRTQYGVMLGRRVIPREGATYAVAFVQPGDWCTVLGWRDLASTTVTLKQSAWSYLLSELSMIFVIGPAVIGAGLLLGGPGVALVLSALVAVVSLVLLYGVIRRNRRVRQGLIAADHSAVP